MGPSNPRLERARQAMREASDSLLLAVSVLSWSPERARHIDTAIDRFKAAASDLDLAVSETEDA